MSLSNFMEKIFKTQKKFDARNFIQQKSPKTKKIVTIEKIKSSKPDKFIKMKRDREVSNSLTDVFHPDVSLELKPSVLRQALFSKKRSKL